MVYICTYVQNYTTVIKLYRSRVYTNKILDDINNLLAYCMRPVAHLFEILRHYCKVGIKSFRLLYSQVRMLKWNLEKNKNELQKHNCAYSF